MKYSVWTGPCGVEEVAEAFRKLPREVVIPGTVVTGTEHVYFESTWLRENLYLKLKEAGGIVRAYAIHIRMH